MKRLFNENQRTRVKRNKFDLSHEKKMTLDMGSLIPIFWKETLPKDTWRIQPEIFLRFLPLLAPVIHRIDVHVHFFKVPIRLIWDEFEDFITGGPDGTLEPEFPWISAHQLLALGSSWSNPGCLADYFGVPAQNLTTTGDEDAQISALPFRAYQLIYSEYYRDQNLQTDWADAMSRASGQVDASGPLTDGAMITTMRQSCWEKDYLTSALPWPQRGAEMLMPMTFAVDEVYVASTGNVNTTSGAVTTDNAGALLNSSPVPIGLRGDNASTTINDLRTAIRIQEWLETNARGGARYIEQLYHHFDVESSDARLQRPEYLGGTRQTVKISEVLSTVEGTEPQGNMSGHGISAGQAGPISTYCEEHCIIMGIMRILPRTAYQDGINRELYKKADKFEYAWPELAHLGEQPVHWWEAYYNTNQTTVAEADQTFGYQSRYANWKYAEDSVHADMRTSLDYWHFGRQFSSLQSLNSDFVEAWPSYRAFASMTERPLVAQIYNKVDVLRALPYFGTPRL